MKKRSVPQQALAEIDALVQVGELALARTRLGRLARKSSGAAPELLHLSGVVELLDGNADAAVGILRQAVDAQPGQPRYRCNLAQALLDAGDTPGARCELQRVLKLSPHYALAHYNLGCLCFGLGEHEAALQAFDAALSGQADNPLWLTAKGDALRELGRMEQAITQYQASLAVDDHQAAAHANLGLLLLQKGELEQGEEHCRQAVTLDAGNFLPHMNLGRCLVLLERLDEAMDSYANALELAPTDAMLCCNVGKVWLEVEDCAQAEFWFSKALQSDPESVEAQCGLAAALREAGHSAHALEMLKSLAETCPQDARVLAELGASWWEEGDADAAVTSYTAALEIRPGQAVLQARVGHVLASAGDVEAAVRCFRQAVAINPGCVAALHGLATSLRSRLSAAERSRMETLLNHPRLRAGALAALHNGLAHYFDSCKDYGRAAQHAEQANGLQWEHRQRRGWAYDRAEYERVIDRTLETFDRRHFERVAGLGTEDARPVFIVGMPRSGTTLTEQILASHPRILGIGERQFAGRSLRSLVSFADRPADEQDLVASVGRKTLQAIADDYLATLAALAQAAGKADAVRIVDKMPDNYSLLGWILTLFPKACIIHCRRDPRDVAVSCWLTQFGKIRWACHHQNIAERIIQYRRVMSHWRRVLPRPMLEIDYETTVADPRGQTRRLLEFLDVDWDDHCLHFQDSQRLVRTASVTQVREPVYQRSVARWKNYQPAMAELMRCLDDL